MKKKSLFEVKYNAVIRRLNRHTGEVLDEEKIHNIVVDNGLDRVAKRLASNVEDFFDYIAIGTGSTAATAVDTTLETETTRALATITNPANGQTQYDKVFTFGSGQSFTITEAGLFDDAVASGSGMFNRLVFTGKAVDSDTSLSVTITITVGRV